jgi:hypothetical protein
MNGLQTEVVTAGRDRCASRCRTERDRGISACYVVWARDVLWLPWLPARESRQLALIGHKLA